jgi:hypothetical protein
MHHLSIRCRFPTSRSCTPALCPVPRLVTRFIPRFSHHVCADRGEFPEASHVRSIQCFVSPVHACLHTAYILIFAGIKRKHLGLLIEWSIVSFWLRNPPIFPTFSLHTSPSFAKKCPEIPPSVPMSSPHPPLSGTPSPAPPPPQPQSPTSPLTTLSPSYTPTRTNSFRLP